VALVRGSVRDGVRRGPYNTPIHLTLVRELLRSIRRLTSATGRAAARFREAPDDRATRRRLAPSPVAAQIVDRDTVVFQGGGRMRYDLGADGTPLSAREQFASAPAQAQKPLTSG